MTDSAGLRKARAAVIISENAESPVKKILCKSLIKWRHNRRCRVNDNHRPGIASLPNRGGQKSALADGDNDRIHFLRLACVVIPVESEFNLAFVTEFGDFFSIFAPDAHFSLTAELYLR